MALEGHQRWGDDIAREQRAGAQATRGRITRERSGECESAHQPYGRVEGAAHHDGAAPGSSQFKRRGDTAEGRCLEDDDVRGLEGARITEAHRLVEGDGQIDDTSEDECLVDGRARLLDVLDAVGTETAQCAHRIIGRPAAIGIEADACGATALGRQRTVSSVANRRHPRLVVGKHLTHRRDLDLDGRAPVLQHRLACQRSRILGGDGRDDGVDRHDLAARLGPGTEGRLHGRGQPERASPRRIVVEGREVTPSTWAPDEHALAHVNAAEASRQRQRIGDGIAQDVGEGDVHVDQGRRGNLAKSGERRWA